MVLAPQLNQDQAERDAQAAALAAFVGAGPTVVLTGAGCSTESGIPDYRGPETRRRARAPIRFLQFVRDPSARQRYWARAMVGWRRFSGKRPNAAHTALAGLENQGRLTGLITQNVDDLHERAGSRAVVALHGSLSEVRCLDCGVVTARRALQERLRALNPRFEASLQQTAEMAPDGDASLPEDLVERFTVAECDRCGGVLKPRVVFFGENVPRPRVERAYAMCDAASRLLVVGSSLEVFSGYRFVRRAAQAGKPVAIVNVGPTRGDGDAVLRLQAVAGQVLPGACELLSFGAVAPSGSGPGDRDTQLPR